VTDRRVSVELLRTFLAVYRAGTLTAAARTLGLSQPSVTGQLRALEAALGQGLFERHARGVTPTMGGHELARRVQGPLDELTALTSDLGRPAGVSGRTLRLGGPAELLAARALPALVATLAAGVRLRTRPGLPDELLLDLAAGNLDLVISTTRPRRGGGAIVEPLCDEEFVLVATPTLRDQLDQQELQERPARALEQLPLLSYAEDMPVLRRWWRHVLGTPLTARAALVVPDLRALRTVALAHGGATVLPRYLCSQDLHDGRLVELLTTDDPPINTLYLVTRPGAREQPHVAQARSALLLQARMW